MAQDSLRKNQYRMAVKLGRRFMDYLTGNGCTLPYAWRTVHGAGFAFVCAQSLRKDLRFKETFVVQMCRVEIFFCIFDKDFVSHSSL